MTTSEQALLTLGEIARRLDVPLHRVEYAVRSRSIRPDARAGNLRVFSQEAVRVIAALVQPHRRPTIEELLGKPTGPSEGAGNQAKPSQQRVDL